MTDTASRAARASLEIPSDDLLAMFDLFDSVMALDGDRGQAAPNAIEQGAILIVAQLIARKIDLRMRAGRH